MFSKCFDEMKPLRPLRSLRLLRLLRLLRFLMAGKSTSNQSTNSFWFSEAKEAVEVIEASDVIMSVEVIGAADVFKTTYILEINKLMARITLFWYFEKEKNSEQNDGISSEILHHSWLRLWRTGMSFSTKSKGHK